MAKQNATSRKPPTKKVFPLKLTTLQCEMLLQSVNECAYQGKHAEGVAEIKCKLMAIIKRSD
jgi:hypothetical protein